MKEADCYSGKRIGRLTLIEKNQIPSTHGHTVGGWLCRCDCGNEKVIRTYALGLEKGRTQSCGCYQREMTSKRSSSSDGDSRKSSKYFRLYTAWCNMKARCYSEGNDDYQNYGGRGIKVCADWKNNYLSFKDWALKNGFDYRKTSQEQSIDRIDVNGDYRPDNCRWTDLQTQASNKTSNIYVWLDGRRYTQQEIAKKYHMGHKTIAYRINQGWDTEKVIAAAYQNLDSSNQLHITINGETKTLVEWSKVSGVKEPTLRSRYMRGIRGAELIKPANQSLNYHKSMKRIQVDGELFTFSELSKQTGLNEKTLRQRYDKGLRWCDLIAPPWKSAKNSEERGTNCMIYVIGSISAGKSTLSEMLAKDLDSEFYLEDVNNGLIKNMLEHFYSAGAESRQQVSAMLQVGFLVVRYMQLKKALVQKNAVLDSNILSDGIMANLIHERGEMDDASFNIYMTLNQEMQANVNGSPWNGFPDLIVYIDIDPDHEIESIQSRGRDMEDIRKDPKLVDYYNSVNKAYKDWYSGFHQATTVKVDREHFDFVNSLEDRNAVLNMIEEKLVELGKLTQDEFEKIKADRAKKFGDPITIATDAQPVTE